MRHMRGMSLLELMVAMALGLLLSAAAIQLFVANQISVNLMRGMNDVQANGRFVVDQVVRDVRVSGLLPNTAGTSTLSVVGLPFTAGAIPGLALTSTAINANATATSSGAGAVPGLLQASDQLVVQYVALNNTEDCEGNTVTAGQFIVARYFVRADNGMAALACDAGTHAGTGGLVNYGDTGQVLLTGVDSFQVLYGIDDGANGVARVSRYVNAATYAAMSPRPTVLTVRIGLYLHSNEAAGNVTRPANDVQILDLGLVANTIPDDRFLRRLFVTTISLRNLILSGV